MKFSSNNILEKNISSHWNIYLNNNSFSQEISSAKTARLQRPKTLKIIKESSLLENGKVLLDVGCGSGNKYFKNEVEALGFSYYGCDPFNQSQDTNIRTINACNNGQSDLITLNNVLNTINEKNIREEILKQCQDALNKKTGVLLILTYEGEKLAKEKALEFKTGIKLKKLTPVKTRDGWQNRMKTHEYLDEIKNIFPNVELLKFSNTKLIVASLNPNLNLKKYF